MIDHLLIACALLGGVCGALALAGVLLNLIGTIGAELTKEKDDEDNTM